MGEPEEPVASMRLPSVAKPAPEVKAAPIAMPKPAAAKRKFAQGDSSENESSDQSDVDQSYKPANKIAAGAGKPLPALGGSAAPAKPLPSLGAGSSKLPVPPAGKIATRAASKMKTFGDSDDSEEDFKPLQKAPAAKPTAKRTMAFMESDSD